MLPQSSGINGSAGDIRVTNRNILVARATLIATKKKEIMSLLDLGPLIFEGIDGQITWFQTNSLLSRQVTCPSCGAAMVLQHRSDIQDKRRY